MLLIDNDNDIRPDVFNWEMNMETDRQGHIKTVQTGFVGGSGPESEDPYPSLSEYHDYEPNLEFDDTELVASVGSGDLEDHIDELGQDFLESPVSDGTIEENFEEELVNAPKLLESGPESMLYSLRNDDEDLTDEDYSDIEKYGIVEVAGDDPYGRKVIIVSACKLPSNKVIDHQRLLKYLMFTLDKYVEQDYSLVYLHYGLNSRNKPTLTWLWQAYRAFDRKYKKNLKALYLVHPTNFIRLVWQVFRAVISAKFGRKVMYVNSLQELHHLLGLPYQLSIPQPVVEHDELISKKSKKAPPPPEVPDADSKFHAPLPTQQFGVSLQFIKDNNDGEVIPPVVSQCVRFLSQPDALETEGIFRRSSNITLLREYQSKLNQGQEVDFSGDVHLAAVLLKTFLRELEEPLMTFDLYDEIVQFQSISKDERLRHVSLLIREKLPEDNYHILKFIVQFLAKVMDRCDLNKMTSSNLAVVFGPNLVWSDTTQLSLSAIGPINMFVDFILTNHEQIFIY